jgi:cob(I)alamin adenosyltransferase
MIYCYTGDGKGKTTAGLGAALRALGYSWNVCVIQFMKGTWYSGELDAIKKIHGLDIVQTGKGFYKILDDNLPESEHRQAAQDAIRTIKERISSGKYQLIILDEVNVAVHLKLLEEEAVLELLNHAPDDIHFILTGRNAPQSFMDISDLVTEMKEIKHPFQKGIPAKEGLDF